MDTSSLRSQSRKGLTQYERFKLHIAKAEAERRIRKKRNNARERAKRMMEARNKMTEARRPRVIKKKAKLLTNYIEALRLKKLQCLNTWGRLEQHEWRRVKEQFIRSVLRAATCDVPIWMKEIDRHVGRTNVRATKTTTVDHGARFEMEVALKLQALGWNVQLLGKCGDQGGDLLAQKADKSVVIQCKHYQSKASNSAVQEVIAGRQFYHATAAAVVASAGFTRQAHMLADKAGVLLLAPDQLSILG
jgi:hypothetical protein